MTGVLRTQPRIEREYHVKMKAEIKVMFLQAMSATDR